MAYRGEEASPLEEELESRPRETPFQARTWDIGGIRYIPFGAGGAGLRAKGHSGPPRTLAQLEAAQKPIPGMPGRYAIPESMGPLLEQFSYHNPGFAAKWGLPIVGAIAGAGLAGLAGGGAAAAGAGALEGTAGYAGVSAPVGTALATGAQEATIADLVATGMSQEAATAAVMSGGETLSGVGTGLGYGGTGTTGTASLSRLLGLNQNQSDWASVLGTLGATGLGAYSANQQSNALENIAAQSRADRAPFLGAATNYLNNPSAYIEGPGQAAMKGTLAGLSAKFGNPIGSGAALQFATDAALGDWRNAVTGFANIGLSGEDSRNQLLAGAAGRQGDIYSTIAGGASDLINPRRSLADLAREYRSLGLI